MEKVKQAAQKHGVTVALLTLLTTAVAFGDHYINKEKSLRERNEVFFSDYQDMINCTLDSLKAIKCK